jgi:malate dehydrogenase (oxaloacetate-decarboxylating)
MDRDDEAIRLHELCAGKIQTMPKCPIRSYEDLAIWYTPGVAAASRKIAAEPSQVFRLTNKGNSVAIVSDGSRVLGLGNIGPEAGLPVMEGKALLFKYFGGVDAVPLCLASRSEDEIVSVVKAIRPSFGGINLEDIAAPKCFRVLDALRMDLGIPVWHDDQQGTAMVVLAALRNALEVVGKRLGDVRIALIGIGAANMAVYRLLRAVGAKAGQFIACDSKGTLHRGRQDIEAAQQTYKEKWQVCQESNPENISGGIAEALRGADVCLAFSRSGPGVILPADVKAMAAKSIVFACANPVPEIWPEEAREADATIVATGRSDFGNQVNNSLAFPGVFRGALDVRARAISDGMVQAAAEAIAQYARAQGLQEDKILPRTDDMDVAATVAAAVGAQAQKEGLAQTTVSYSELKMNALKRIESARNAAHALLEAGLIPRA